MVVALAGLGAAVALALHPLGYRAGEAWAAGGLTHLVSGDSVFVNRGSAQFYVDWDRPDGFGLTVTPECTSAIVTIGVCGVTAVLVLASRIRVSRLLLAGVAAAAAFFVLNLLRLVGIALATQKWGLRSGFHWSHVWAGTFVTVFGGIAVVVLYLMMLGMRHDRRVGQVSG